MMLELTAACNARCPGCARTGFFIDQKKPINGPVNIDMHIIEKLFSAKWPNLKAIAIDGNYGDSLHHPQSLEILEYIADSQDQLISIDINSNGGYHSEEWWYDLAQLLNTKYKMPYSYVQFGIDGIDNDSHQKYRINVDFDKVIRNAQAFIAGGGIAEWKWIGFDWNDQLLEHAKQMAQDLGFSSFAYKNTRVRSNIIKNIDKNHKTKEINVSNINSKISTDIVNNTLKEIESADDFLNNSNITCAWRSNRKYGFQVEHNGLVWQCCHLSGVYSSYNNMNSRRYNEYKYYNNKYYNNWNSLHHNTIHEILSHSYFQSDLESSWNNTLNSDVNPRLKRCVEKCGKFNEPK
jgi:MoaA/NifB/PqqE/SkfB family radical SAM enzyme